MANNNSRFGAVVQVVFLQNVVYETLMLGRAF